MEDAKKQIVNFLAGKGKKIIEDAYLTKDTRDRTYNLVDAYGFAVFCDRKKVKYGYAGAEMSEKVHKGWAKRGIPAGTGRKYIDDFFDDYQSTIGKDIELVCVNAAYYASILEAGKQGGVSPVHYHIISQMRDEFDNLQNGIQGSTVSIIKPGG